MPQEIIYEKYYIKYEKLFLIPYKYIMRVVLIQQ